MRQSKKDALQIIAGFLAIVLFCVVAVSCNGEMKLDAESALHANGLRDVTLGSRAWFSCSEDDLYKWHFTAKNVANEPVSGNVCCGYLKGCTVRY